MKKTLFILCLYLLCSSLCLTKPAKAQSKDEINLHRLVIQAPQPNKVYKEAKNNRNEIQYFFSGLFLFYKSFVSSQDLSVCTFTPSCSEYGLLAIKKNGLIVGGIQTMDRLSRCNGLSPQKYDTDLKARLLIDKP